MSDSTRDTQQEPCRICGGVGFHRAECVLFSYPCAICGARISKRNEFDHVHKPLPLYVGKPDDDISVTCAACGQYHSIYRACNVSLKSFVTCECEQHTGHKQCGACGL